MLKKLLKKVLTRPVAPRPTTIRNTRLGFEAFEDRAVPAALLAPGGGAVEGVPYTYEVSGQGAGVALHIRGLDVHPSDEFLIQLPAAPAGGVMEFGGDLGQYAVQVDATTVEFTSQLGDGSTQSFNVKFAGVKGTAYTVHLHDAVADPTAVTPTVTFGGIETASGNFTYNGTAQSPTATVDNGDVTTPLTYLYTGVGDTAYGPSNEAPTNAGTYSVVASYPGGTVNGVTYTAASSSPMTYTIDKAALIATAKDDTKSYDGQPYLGGNGLTFNGFVNGETSLVLDGTNLSYGGTAQWAVNPGTYSITVSGLASGNYDISYQPGTLTITFPQQTPGGPTNFSADAQAALNVGKNGSIGTAVTAVSPAAAAALNALTTAPVQFRFAFTSSNVTTPVYLGASIMPGTYIGNTLSLTAANEVTKTCALVTSANTSASTSITVTMTAQVSFDGVTWFSLGTDTMKGFKGK